MRNRETAPPDVVPLQYQRNTLTSNGQRAAQLLISHYSLLIKNNASTLQDLQEHEHGVEDLRSVLRTPGTHQDDELRRALQARVGTQLGVRRGRLQGRGPEAGLVYAGAAARGQEGAVQRPRHVLPVGQVEPCGYGGGIQRRPERQGPVPALRPEPPGCQRPVGEEPEEARHVPQRQGSDRAEEEGVRR